MADIPMVCVRVEQFANWAAVASMAGHGNRTLGRLGNVDRDRTPQNMFESAWGDPHDPAACMRALMRHHGARIRRGGSPGTHMLLTASPEFFRPNDPDAVGTWERARLEAWMAANRAWLDKRFPGQVAALRVDLDESTPHCDVFLVPLNWRTTKTGKRIVEVSHRTQFSKGRGPRAYSQLQTEYAEAMEHLGLSRGRPRTETAAVHRSPATMRAELGAAKAEARGFVAGIQAWADGRMRDMDWTEKGRPTAHFRADVTAPERRRLFEVCRPAWDALVAFSRRLNRALRKAINQDVEAARANCVAAKAALTEAQLLLNDLAVRDADIAAQEAARLDDARRALSHYR